MHFQWWLLYFARWMDRDGCEKSNLRLNQPSKVRIFNQNLRSSSAFFIPSAVLDPRSGAVGQWCQPGVLLAPHPMWCPWVCAGAPSSSRASTDRVRSFSLEQLKAKLTLVQRSVGGRSRCRGSDLRWLPRPRRPCTLFCCWDTAGAARTPRPCTLPR